MSEKPDWRLLPHDPVSFFSLPDDYDRKTLKRGYNRLLKQYKPEKFPAEFQRIREAYERLEARLRKQPASQAAQPPEGRLLHVDGFEEELARFYSRRHGQPSSEDLIADPAGAYKSLSALPDKEPPDYYLLALLSDVVHNHPQLFVEHLLTGLEAFPGDQGLFTILAHHAHGPIPDDQLITTAVLIFHRFRDVRAFGITVPLWRRALLCQPFSEWRASLAEADRLVRGQAKQERAIFYLNLCRNAFWKADPDWLCETRALIREAFALLDPFEHELEILEALFTYRDKADVFARDHPLRERIHGAIVAWCEQPEWEGERVFLQLQQEMSSGTDILDAVDSETPGAREAFHVLELIGTEVAYRLGEGDREPSLMLDQEVILFVIGLRKLTRISTFGVFSRFAKTAVITLVLYGMLLFPMYVGGLLEYWFGSHRPGVYFFFVWIAFAFTVFEKPVRTRFRALQARWKIKILSRVWRPETARFLRESGLGVDDLAVKLQSFPRSLRRFARELLTAIYDDFGLRFYELALRFRIW